MIIYQLLRPLHYLTITHNQKAIFDWVIPTAFAAVQTIYFLFVFGDVNLYGSEGFVSQVGDFVQTLPGFYIAALAAIATFNRTDIDRTMPDPAPKIKIVLKGQTNTIDLTRRRFLCMLFAFLTFESIVIAVVSVVCVASAGAAASLFPQCVLPYIRLSVFFFWSLAVWQMLIATVWGLYYLGDKLHQPD